jgi:two-component system LytT family sensor kinase
LTNTLPTLIQDIIFTAMNKKVIKWVHVVFWLLLVCSDAFPDFLSRRFDVPKISAAGHFSFFDYLIIAIAYALVSAFCFYSSYLFVAKSLFSKGKVLGAISGSIAIIIATIGLRYLIEFCILKPTIGFDNYKGVSPDFYHYARNVFFFYMPSYFIYGIMYFFLENWFWTIQNQQDILKEKLTAELAFLRSQINPHYLFNTINDIYTLVYQKADEAPDALLKLSEMLRYMLRESQTDKMPLEKEITYLKNMIELPQISAKGKIFIEFDVHIKTTDIQVPSLLFISFLENAFKHGIFTDPKFPLIIRLDVTDDHLTFLCNNRKAKVFKDKTGGIGLSNVQRRLELLYPKKHQLKITDDEDFYCVELILALT